jgi:formate hydrogenlyase subunit 6/NADH:ubiquinone oxidoreductase subunit I
MRIACGICEKICPNQAIRIVREESGNSLICLTPWKCSACGLCVRLCLTGGLSGMHGVRVPCLTEVPLVRIERSTPHD